MEIKKLLGEVMETSAYKDFKSENSDSFFSAVFAILDVKGQSNQIQFDFFLPSLKKIASFNLGVSGVNIYDDEIKNMKPQSVDVGVDIKDLEEVCGAAIKKNGSMLVPTKIIAILRDGIWNLTCMDEALGIVRIKVDADSGKVEDFSKGSLMDFMGIRK